MNRGIVLTGGGAMIRGLDKLIAEETEVPVYIAENALDCVALGTGLSLAALDDPNAQGILSSRTKRWK